MQQLAWTEAWDKKNTRDTAIRTKEKNLDLAATQTSDAKDAVERLKTILNFTLQIDDTINWDNLIGNYPSSPKLLTSPTEPNKSDSKYKPKIGIFELIFSKLKQKREIEAEKIYLKDRDQWLAKLEEVNKQNSSVNLKYLQEVEKWELNKEAVLANKEKYFSRNSDAIIDYCEMVLANSKYPDYFFQEWDLDYQEESKVIIVDYSLPNIESIPKVKSVKYVASRNDFSESYLTENEINKLYDDVLYQISLRTIHELFEADVIDGLSSVVFNGWVDSIDKTTGKNVNACIMSIHASKEEFLNINLEKVDPKACFKKLKGIGSSQLYGISPIAPILSINKEDRRFVSAYDVLDEVNESNNLASMHWQDFENLIRELFEKEFQTNGGEVKITQASRDGGVDAVAFDPDPIRGGKIVIQAKRYTNIVGVSAVRDLYGTTLNEGATKGILVTTANFGPDAFEFAKGKPLTLLSGNNLLHLLEKHGYKAKIDLKEAKKIIAERADL
jgi:restriction system protein